MGKKVVTSIRIDEEVLKEAKEIGLNISKICENALKEAIRRLKGEKPSKNSFLGFISKVAPGVGFEPTRPIGATSSPGLSPPLRFAPYLAGRPRPRILMMEASI